jgi:ectoine hydroxylase-related dioxygenase (phytanoyl-CoA dioxygenase family)
MIENENLIEELDIRGFCNLGILIDQKTINKCLDALINYKKEDIKRFGDQVLKNLNEYEVVRDLCSVSDVFINILANNFLNDFVNKALNERATIYSYNAVLTDSVESSENFLGYDYHRDTQYFNGIRTAIVVMIPLVDTFQLNGATIISPGTHLFSGRPSSNYLENHHIHVSCPAGAAYCVDGALWHKAGINKSGLVRPLIAIEYKLAPFKQQIDYCSSNALSIDGYPEIVKKRLGWDARVCSSVDEYRVDPVLRRFKSGNYVMGNIDIFKNRSGNLK